MTVLLLTAEESQANSKRIPADVHGGWREGGSAVTDWSLLKMNRVSTGLRSP